MSKALVIIDAQNDFITGPLGSVDAVRVVPNIVEKIKSLKSGDRIYYTFDTHYKDYLHDTLEGFYLPVVHCVKDTPGWQINTDILKAIQAFQKVNNTQVTTAFFKHTFGDPDLLNIILDDILSSSVTNEYYKLDEIEVCGFCTDICVISNALILKANPCNIPVKLNKTCCAGSTPELHESALKVMKACQVEVY